MEEPSQFSVGQTAQCQTCSIMEKPGTGLDDCLNMLMACFRKGMSAARSSNRVHVMDISTFRKMIPSKPKGHLN